MMLNLFIASILVAFEDANLSVNKKMQVEQSKLFRNSWQKFDPHKSGKIHAIDLLELINNLPDSLKVFHKNEISENKIFNIIRKAKLPI